MEKMKELDEAIMSLRIKIGRNESVTDDDLYKLMVLNFKVTDNVEHLLQADEIVRKLAKIPELEPIEIADALKQAQSYTAQNPK